MRCSRMIHEACEPKSTGKTPPVLTEDSERGSDVLPPPPDLLNECSIGYPSEYRDRTYKERVRDAVYALRAAIHSEAFSRFGDDGRVMRKLEIGEEGPWGAIDRMLAKEIFVDQFDSLVDKAVEVLDGFFE